MVAAISRKPVIRMPSQADPDVARRAVRLWLLSVAGLIFLIVLVGGATRLTESGLSIVEWRPLTGVVPPLSTAQWQGEFEKYQAIPQYRLVTRGMALADFKTIYWWEWGHRLLGRLIGAAFLLPFLWFMWRGWIGPALRAGLWTLFALGALQGAVGWWMVASGLAERTEVSQYRLAIHLVLPCMIFAVTIFTAQRLVPRGACEAPPRIRVGALALVVVVLLQIYLGALLAGLRGGLIYSTWPLIEGRFFPPFAELAALSPGWRNLFENILTVQFAHRITAYLLVLLAVLHALDVGRTMRGPVLAGAVALVAAIVVQASLGIMTLIHQVPIALALAHQGTAIIVLAAATIHAERLQPRRQASRLPAAAGIGRTAT
jgi:cytochrome c oxidase assembly protein subunit 15